MFESTMEAEQGQGDSLRSFHEGGGGDADAVKEKGTLALVDLEEAVKNMSLVAGAEEKSRLVLKLETARMKVAVEERLVKKLAWREETRKEVLERAQFQERMIRMPPEEWEEILNKVEDSKDKRTMSDMCLLWRELMKKDRTRFLFHRVFDIMYRYQNLKKADMLFLRLVCREWLNSIQLHFENRFELHWHLGLDANEIRPWFRQGDSGALSRFRTWSTSTYAPAPEGNPFIARAVVFGDLHSGVPWPLTRSFWTEVEHLLRDWGGQLWKFGMVVDPGTNLTRLYHQLHRFLPLMPNLRVVSIVFKEDLDTAGFQDPAIKAKQKMELESLEQEYPLPDLPHLKCIGTGLVSAQLINLLLRRYSGTVEALSVATPADNPNDYGAGTNLPNFKAIIVNSNTFRVDDSEADLSMNWPILKMISRTYLEMEAAVVPDIFRQLSLFGETGQVKQLKLELCKKSGPLGMLDKDQLKMLRLNMPHVEECSLSVSHINLKGIDFLLPMTKLKRLQVNYTGTTSTAADNQSGEEIIKFTGYTDRFYESNIWRLHPELSFVVIKVINTFTTFGDWKGKIYTRAGYKQHLVNANASSSGDGTGQSEMKKGDAEAAPGLAVPSEGEQIMRELEQAVKNFDPEQRSSVVLKLQAARQKAAAEKGQIKKVNWNQKEANRKEVRERAQFQERMVKLHPKEWEGILDKVEDCKDKRVMSGMSLSWREAAKKDRTRFLFHEVFPILFKTTHLSPAEILQVLECRLVCQEWRNCIDSHLAELIPLEIGKGWIGIRPRLLNLEDVSRFGEWAASTYIPGEGNPFPTRSLQIGSLRTGMAWPFGCPFWLAVEELLKDWGSEVRQVLICLHPGTTRDSFNLALRSFSVFLERMPTLKVLGILFCDHYQGRQGFPHYKTLNNKIVMEQVLMEKLPALPKLKMIGAAAVPPAVLNALLRKYGSQLERLSFGDDEKDNPHDFSGGLDLPLLKDLLVYSDTFHVHVTEKNGFPLKVPCVEVAMVGYQNVKAEFLPNIFAGVNGFGGSLKRLVLMLENYDGPSVEKLKEDQLKTLSLDLPRLEVLSVRVCRLNLKGMDFILPLVALKRLNVTYVRLVTSFKKKESEAEAETGSSSSSPKNSNEIIKFHDYTNRLYESNIWELFPHLKNVTIDVDINLKKKGQTMFEPVMGEDGKLVREEKKKKYTREGYLQHLAKGH